MVKWWCIFLLGVAPLISGQQPELDRLVVESMRLREQFRQDPGKVTRPDWARLRHLLCDWIESPSSQPPIARPGVPRPRIATDRRTLESRCAGAGQGQRTGRLRLIGEALTPCGIPGDTPGGGGHYRLVRLRRFGISLSL